MSFRRIFGCVFFSILLAFLTISPSGSTSQNTENSTLQATALIAGRNINMISGKQLPFGDPFLQRQNEPSIAVSSRNPMHILAGANDYRTVDLLIPYEEIPGYEGAAARDAWLGLYKSFDGGQSWKSSLLPGFPLDYTSQGSSSPLKAYGTAADPVVRAGTSGMFYYCGLAFNRNQTENSVFVARLIDNNNSEDQSVDSIKYIDAKIIDKGNAGQFIDKPWLAVDIPRSGAKRVTIQGSGIPSQTISAGNVYLAYSIFTGQAASNPFSKVYLARSIDCGTTWENATKLSESSHVNQGVTIAISPATGYIYVAWRRFAHGNDGHAIMSCYSTDGGKKFSNPKEVAAVQSFDQGTTGTSFRTNTYPALTVDHNGIVYLAWAQRGIGPGGDARIVVSTSANGNNWSTPQAVDNHSGPGHQFMPALSYSAGKVTAVWYDQRYDVSQHWHSYISDEPGQQKRHTIDIRAAQAAASASPLFEASAQVSRYLHLTDADGQFHQVQFSPPNYPMFKEGTTPFHGDYVDLTPAPMFVPVSGGGWAYNIDGNQSPVFHAAWTDNRNVKPPKNGNWSNYAPPSSTQDPLFRSTMTCQPGQTSMRNQDVYMASLTRGLIVGSPVNMKPLSRLANKHSFVVFVKNMTGQKRRFLLTIVPASGVTASFKQFTTLTTLEVEVARYSSVSRTVFATGPVRFASIRVNVEEISGPDGNPVSGGLKGYVVLNPDIENPDIENPDIENNELHNPDIENPDIENPDIENVNVLNPDIENPDIENPDIINPDIENPDIENPDIENPDIENPGWLNPDIENPDIENPDIENGSISDYTWKVANTGNTASAYAFKMISAGFKESQYPGFGFQLLIYRVHTSPAATSQAYSCVLTLKHHDELIANIIKPIIFNPDIENPDIENPDIENPDIENATFWLAPGDKAYITLRVYDPNKNDNVKFDPTVTPVTGVTTGQAVNSANENDPNPTPPISSPITNLTIWNDYFPDGTPGTSYNAYLVALGGTPHYTWSITEGSLPTGLSFNADTGAISGTPTTAGEFNFTVQVTDSSSPAKTATKSLIIHIVAPLQITTATLPAGTVGTSYSATLAATGGVTPFTWSIISGSLPPGLTCTSAGVISGNPTATGTYSFTVQVKDSGLPQNTATKPLSIIVTAVPSANEWIAIYNGPGNGEDKVGGTGIGSTSCITFDSAGNVYVTGQSVGTGGAGFDMATIKYDSSGIQKWFARYNGPNNEDDYGRALAVDSEGSVYVTGYSYGASTAMTGVTIKYNSQGVEQWAKQKGSMLRAIATDSAGNVYAAGYTETGVNQDFVTIKYSSSGVLEWIKTYDNGSGNRENLAMDIAVDGAGNIYVTGWSNYLTGGNIVGRDFATVKYNNAGVQQWVATYNGPGNGEDDALKVAVDGAGNVYVTGIITQSGTGYDYATVKYDSLGVQQWVATYNGSGSGADEAIDIAVDASSNVYVTGSSSNGTNADFATIKYGSNGTQLWVARYNGPGNGDEVAMALGMDSLGNVYVAGKSLGSGTVYDIATVKYDSQGNELWVRRYNGPGNGNDEASGIAVDSYGYIYVGGASTGIGTYFDCCTIKYVPVYGQATDPAGDAIDDNRVSPDPDLVAATGTVIGSDLVLNVQFTPGTFDSATSCAGFLLDTDQNPSTGHPGANSLCIDDASLIGSEFIVNMVPNYSPPKASVYSYNGSCNDFSFVGYVNLTLQTNGMEVKIPLSLLNNDDGRLNFKVTSFAALSGGGFTGVLDYMSNLTVPPGKIR